MEIKGVHFLALDKTKKRIEEIEEEYKAKVKELEEALKDGDLRENSPVDAAREQVNRLARERDDLTPVVTMPVVKANDNITVFEAGSVIKLTIHNVTQTPVTAGTSEFEKLKELPPAFEGVLMYGGTLGYQELLLDYALADDTPVGKFLLGRQPGDYSISVPAGFANVTAEKLKTTVGLEDLYCKV